MQVIRCEHPTQPLKGGVYGLLPYEQRRRWDGLPLPRDDRPTSDSHAWGCRLGWADRDHHCAVLPEQLDLWFPPAIREHMRQAGFRFVVLDAPTCAVLEYQCVINRIEAEVVGEYLQ